MRTPSKKSDVPIELGLTMIAENELRPSLNNSDRACKGKLQIDCLDFGDALPIVATVNQTMAALGIGREKLYQLVNSGDLESYKEGTSRKILRRSIEAYVIRRLDEEAARRSRA